MESKTICGLLFYLHHYCHLEGFILAAQDQSLATGVHQAKTVKNGADRRSRLCAHSEETINHMTSGCPIIANTENLQRHDQVAKFMHWTLDTM